MTRQNPIQDLIVPVFWRNMNDLQLCQAIAYFHIDWHEHTERNALDRVILHTISGHPTKELNACYGREIPLNDILDAVNVAGAQEASVEVESPARVEEFETEDQIQAAFSDSEIDSINAAMDREQKALERAEGLRPTDGD